MKPTPRALSLVFLLALVVAVLGHASPASAQTEVINVPAVSFMLQGNATYSDTFGTVDGIATTVARAAIHPRPGQQICRLSFWAHDNDALDVTAEIVRKRISADAVNPFGTAPEIIATVTSSGAADTLRRFSTFTISQPAVTSGFWYWLDLHWAGVIQVAGVRVDTAASCP